MTTLPRDYDAWRLSGPDEGDAVGLEDGEPCNRFPEPDEDMPRGYRPKRCKGTMEDVDGFYVCDICGEIA